MASISRIFQEQIFLEANLQEEIIYGQQGKKRKSAFEDFVLIQNTA